MGILEHDPTKWFAQGVEVDTNEIDELIEARNSAREAKDYKKADQIRDDLNARGVVIEDSNLGTTWRIAK